MAQSNGEQKPIAVDLCENCGEPCGATKPYGVDCSKYLRFKLSKLTTSRAHNVPDARYGFWHHLEESQVAELERFILADRKQHELELLDRLERAIKDGGYDASYELSCIKAERERLGGTHGTKQ